MDKSQMEVGKEYCFSDETRIFYIGDNFSGNGYWHQFTKEIHGEVWCELTDSDLRLIEEVK